MKAFVDLIGSRALKWEKCFAGKIVVHGAVTYILTRALNWTTPSKYEEEVTFWKVSHSCRAIGVAKPVRRLGFTTRYEYGRAYRVLKNTPCSATCRNCAKQLVNLPGVMPHTRALP